MEHLIKLVTTAELVQSISLWVSIAVIILLFITFSSSFYIYYRYYRRCIDHELEDEYIRKEIKGENKKFFRNFEKLRDDENLSKEAKVEEYRKELLVDHVTKKMRIKNGLKILANTVLVLTYIVFIFAMTFALYTRASGEQFYLGDTSYVVIQSGSMDEPVETNTYIQDNNLTDQIRTYSLIGLEKVDSESDIELYDIVAYYNNEGELIVHRVISIQTNDQGETTYTLRGDANSFTDDIERALTFDQIEAKYNGFQNFGLGIVINYARSNIGIITISLGLILIAVYDFFDIVLGKRINVRKEILYPIMDEENINELGGYIVKEVEEVTQTEEVIEQIATTQEVSQVSVEGVEEVQEEAVPEEVVEETLETLEEPLETLEETKAAPQTEIIEGEDKTIIAPIPVIVPLEGEEETKKPRKKMVPFVKKLARIDDDLKKKYEELRNYCLSYGLKERISVPYNTFRLKKVRYVVFAIRGKALILHFALEYKDYEDSPITVKDDSVKVKYEDVPVLFRVKSNLSLKRAYILIDDTMARANIERKYDFVSLYKDDQLDDTDDDNLDLDIDYDDEEYEEYEEEVVETEETQAPSETDVIPLVVPVEEPTEEVEEDLDDDDDEEDESEEEVIEIAPDGTRIRKPFVKFITRLENLNEDLKLKYQELVNYAESFGLKGRISRTCITFRLKRNKYLVIQIRGKALKLRYNLVEADLGEDNKIPVKDHSSKLKWAPTPLYFKVKSDLSIRRAKTLIDIMMNKFGITQVTPFWSILVKPLETVEEINTEDNVDQAFGISETIEESTPEVEEPTKEVVEETIEPVEETSETTEVETSLQDSENVEEVAEEVTPEIEETIEEIAEEIPEEGISEDEVSSEESSEELVIKKKRNPVVKFRTKLQNISEDLLNKYEELVDYIDNYPVKGRISTMGHTFRLHTVTYIIIQQRGDALRLHFKLNLEDLGEDNKIPAKDDSKKVKFVLTPLMFKVKSDLSLRRAKELVDKTMEKAGFTKIDKKEKYKDLLIDEAGEEEVVDETLDIEENIDVVEENVDTSNENEVVENVEEVSENPSNEEEIVGETSEEVNEEVTPEVEESAEEIVDDVEESSEESVDESDEAEEEIPSEEVVQEDESTEKVVVKKKRNPVVKFRTKLQSIDPDLLRKYEELTKYIEEYPLHGRISTMGHSYRLHTITYIVIQQRGDSLRLHFKLNLEDLGEDNKIPAKDDSKKVKFVLTPLMFKVKSDLSLRRAKELVDKTMEKANISKK